VHKASLLALALLILPGLGAAEPTSCPEEFAGGKPPMLVNPKLAAQTTALCFDHYAVLDSGLTRTPLWSAERLTGQAVEDARGVGRVNAFHAERRLPFSERAELSDYVRSGFDRGHMTPSGDMPDARSQRESFSLANVVPQAPRLNRGVWEGIESAMRDLAVQDGELFVVTGPLFQGSDLQALKGRVLVPTNTFKAVYDPSYGRAGAYVCTNTDEPECRTVSIDQLRQVSGIDVFPALPQATKAARAPLPEPMPYGYARRRLRGHQSRD
jgi:endonuclease G, mitochondrial